MLHLLLLLAPPPRVDPLGLLRQALEAEVSVPLVGKQVIRESKGGQIVRRALRLVVRGTWRSKATFLSPPRLRGQAILRLPDKEVRLIPRCRMALIIPLPGTPKERLERRFRLIVKNFDVRLVGRDRVCGRTAFVLELRRRKLKGFPTLRVWVDAERKVILRTMALSPRGPTLDISFVELRFVPRAPTRELALPLRGFKEVRPYGPPVTDPAALKRIAPFPLTLPRKPPPGFVFESGSVGRTPRGPFVVLHYTDGIHTLSLFQWEAGERPPFPRIVRGIRWEAEGKHFALVSSLPLRLLAALSRHFRK